MTLPLESTTNNQPVAATQVANIVPMVPSNPQAIVEAPKAEGSIQGRKVKTYNINDKIAFDKEIKLTTLENNFAQYKNKVHATSAIIALIATPIIAGIFALINPLTLLLTIPCLIGVGVAGGLTLENAESKENTVFKRMDNNLNQLQKAKAAFANEKFVETVKQFNKTELTFPQVQKLMQFFDAKQALAKAEGQLKVGKENAARREQQLHDQLKRELA